MKYNNFLFAALLIILILASINVNADEFKAAVSNHNLIINPDKTTVISGENTVINIEIQNTDEDKIFIKLEAKDIPESWVSYENEKRLFNIQPRAAENAKVTIHIPEGRIGNYNVKIIARNPETNVEVIKTLKIEALPPKDKGMSGIPIFPLAQQPILLLLDIIHLIFNGIVSFISGIFG